MARFTAILQTIVQNKLDGGMTRPQAFANVGKKNHKSIAEWYDHIDFINERFNGNPPDEWKDVIGKVTEAIALERELLRDLDELEASAWGTA